jgi:hypothetical protein
MYFHDPGQPDSALFKHLQVFNDRTEKSLGSGGNDRCLATLSSSTHPPDHPIAHIFRVAPNFLFLE